MVEEKLERYIVVALDELKEKAPILFVSPDLQLLDPNFELDALDDASLDTGWVNDAKPGLYRLDLKGWSHQTYEGEHDCGWDVRKATLLVAFPPYGAHQTEEETANADTLPAVDQPGKSSEKP